MEQLEVLRLALTHTAINITIKNDTQAIGVNDKNQLIYCEFDNCWCEVKQVLTLKPSCVKAKEKMPESGKFIAVWEFEGNICYESFSWEITGLKTMSDKAYVNHAKFPFSTTTTRYYKRG